MSAPPSSPQIFSSSSLLIDLSIAHRVPCFTYLDVKKRENSHPFGRSYKNFSKPAFHACRRRVRPKNQKSVPQPCYFAASAPSSFCARIKETSHPRRMAGAFHQGRSSETETMSLFANASVGTRSSAPIIPANLFILVPPYWRNTGFTHLYLHSFVGFILSTTSPVIASTPTSA